MTISDGRWLLFFAVGAVLFGSPAWPAADLEAILLSEPNRPITDTQVEEAAALLDDDAPFVRATAEWIISRKVETDNSGQDLVRPKDESPVWFQAWRERPFLYRLACDYARQAMRHRAHHSGNGLAQSARLIMKRAEWAAALVQQRGPARYASEVAPQVTLLRERVSRFESAVQADPGALKAHRKAWIELRLTARPVALAALGMDVEELLFIKRHAAHSHRNITGLQYPWVHEPGGDIFRMSLEEVECTPHLPDHESLRRPGRAVDRHLREP